MLDYYYNLNESDRASLRISDVVALSLSAFIAVLSVIVVTVMYTWVAYTSEDSEEINNFINSNAKFNIKSALLRANPLQNV
ncbi:hypothetical protein BdWA1_002733 [Babesia duncani]|uniref:Uncharacterized protein n=1 Tax=Babesia duncani TaxID=323732 RepID=A0AAD9UNL2_9APIC|nr:hypothetical protein BdWA1_002733 [Babesia duncani]